MNIVTFQKKLHLITLLMRTLNTSPLRIIRFELSDGKYENLITNLPVHEFHTEDFKELYFMRWNEETAFRYLKYSLLLYMESALCGIFYLKKSCKVV